MTEWHQDLCPNGLVSLDRQDLDKALTGTATAAVTSAHLQVQLQMLFRAQFLCRSWNKQGGIGDRKLRRRGLEEDGGRGFQEKCEGCTDGMHCRKNLGQYLFLGHHAGWAQPYSISSWQCFTDQWKRGCWNGYQINKQKWCYWAHVTT